MNASGYCTANSYDFKALEEHLKQKHKITSFGLEAIHLTIDEKDVCLFSYGCVTFWDFTKQQEQDFLKELKPFEVGSIEHDHHNFEYSIGATAKVSQDVVTMSNKMPLDMQKLAVSYGLSQSLKLSVFETKIYTTIEKTRHLPEELATTGKISLSRKQLSQQIGNLFLERNSINLHTDILDSPTFFWDHPEYDHIYGMTVKDLDLEARTNVLNKRLDIIRELFEVLNDTLNHRHSTFLELIIIALISIEVIISLIIHF